MRTKIIGNNDIVHTNRLTGVVGRVGAFDGLGEGWFVGEAVVGTTTDGFNP